MRKSVSPLLILLVTGVAGDLGEFTLTMLHNNDRETELIDAGTRREDSCRVTHFKTLPDRIRFHEVRIGYAVSTVSSGDNFLARPEFTRVTSDAAWCAGGIDIVRLHARSFQQVRVKLLGSRLGPSTDSGGRPVRLGGFFIFMREAPPLALCSRPSYSTGK